MKCKEFNERQSPSAYGPQANAKRLRRGLDNLIHDDVY